MPLREEYLNAINEIGEWYINHVPTYQGQLELEKLADYIGDDKYYKTYNLKSKQVKYKIFSNESSKDYITISTGSNARSIENLDENTEILKAKEEAVVNYKDNYRKIDIKSSQAYYPCEYIQNSKDSYKKAGDDCVRFFFTVMNSFDKDFTYRLSKIANKSIGHINTEKFYIDENDFVRAMCMNGFEIYSSKVFNLRDFTANVIDKNFQLEYGDLIVRKGHIHIFLGEGNGVANNFGWGKVNRIFPQKYFYELEGNELTGYYITCDKDINEFDGTKKHYERIYRYKGGLKSE